jgi:hypothetical protein
MYFHFIPSTSVSYPDHGISYQVAKFLYPKQPISYSFHFPLISLPDSLYVRIHLQLKELVMFADSSYDQIMLLSLHPVPRDVCDRHRLHPHARHRTHFHWVVKHDHKARTASPLCQLHWVVKHDHVWVVKHDHGGEESLLGTTLSLSHFIDRLPCWVTPPLGT